jgi:hypothetical protein
MCYTVPPPHAYMSVCIHTQPQREKERERERLQHMHTCSCSCYMYTSARARTHTHTHTRAHTHTCTQHRGYQNTSSAQCADREKDRGRVGGWVAGVGFLGCVSTGVIRTHPTNCVLVQVWQPNNFFLFSKVSALVNAFTA